MISTKRRVFGFWLVAVLVGLGVVRHSMIMRSMPVVEVGCSAFSRLSQDDRIILERHLRSGLRWDIREERDKGHDRKLRFAIRLEPSDPADERAGYNPGTYPVTLNGYYGDVVENNFHQSRVLLGLGAQAWPGFWGRWTRVRAGLGRTPVGVWREGASPNYESSLIVQGGSDVTLEIYEEGVSKERQFTQAALNDFCTELQSVLSVKDEIMEKGFAEHLIPKGSIRKNGKASIEVTDSSEGIYRVTAWVNPGEAGFVRLKMFAAGRVPSGELYTSEMDNSIIRYTGWSPDRQVLFRYQSLVTIFEKNGDDLYPARFELWFQPKVGTERKLIETTRMIKGWRF